MNTLVAVVVVVVVAVAALHGASAQPAGDIRLKHAQDHGRKDQGWTTTTTTFTTRGTTTSTTANFPTGSWTTTTMQTTTSTSSTMTSTTSNSGGAGAVATVSRCSRYGAPFTVSDGMPDYPQAHSVLFDNKYGDMRSFMYMTWNNSNCAGDPIYESQLDLTSNKGVEATSEVLHYDNAVFCFSKGGDKVVQRLSKFCVCDLYSDTRTCETGHCVTGRYPDADECGYQRWAGCSSQITTTIDQCAKRYGEENEAFRLMCLMNGLYNAPSPFTMRACCPCLSKYAQQYAHWAEFPCMAA
ncbi:hypothetical protein PTSG_05349 [Salpingoeca rosetta]|uniref:Uncharacterized protein n=1 Tax=Salpingoeca rosetta (strain ATCC 50818 / BSB-021) TaxID=946362 RepID=F2UA65_SALR5|nr:uncharacterized protein PTSG_05349 [Salpingoeca rosetta]EGD73640.1 hypothetical protein PTSG_05349 [Salpingoeca rosetta]|eukprot:XP_004993921.1 hypothetical protein PTSG_05349 [Salpingoeca rosetta]